MYITKPENIHAEGKAGTFTLSLGSTYRSRRAPHRALTAVGYVVDEQRPSVEGQMALCGLMLRDQSTDVVEPHGIDELELDVSIGPKIALWQGALRHVGMTPEGLHMYLFQDTHPFLLDSNEHGEALVARLSSSSPCQNLQ